MNCVRVTFFTLIVLFVQSTAIAQQDSNELQREKMSAFAKTYGYVRFFHPSDQAAAVDWNLMALYGAKQVLESDKIETVHELMMKVFDPIVVDLDVYQGGEKPRPAKSDASKNDVIAWQHIGVGLQDGASGFYRSARTNRSRQVETKADNFGNALQRINVDDLRGKEIRFRFQAKVNGPKCHLQGWLRVDRESKKRGLFDNMGDRPIRSREWNQYEISGIVDDDAKALFVGTFLIGNGSGLIDDCKLEKKDGDQWTAVEILNPDFEEGESRPSGWNFTSRGYDYSSEIEDVATGKQALRIKRGSKSVAGGILDDIPKMGEVVDVEIGDNLRIRMPLALSTDHKYDMGDDETTDSLVDAIANMDVTNEDDRSRCVANVIILWNVFQHFYPYHEQVSTDWDQVLEKGLARALMSKSRPDSTRVLKWLVAQLHDGHGRLMDSAEMRGIGFVPLKFDWVEDQMIVVASDDERIQIGDVVSHINDQSALDYVTDAELLISGSPQWKRNRSMQEASMGKRGGDLKLKLLRDDNEILISLKFDQRQTPQPKKREVIEVLIDSDEANEKIFYVDLGQAEPKDVNLRIAEFAAAKGIVFDLRGYPKGTQYLFQHMTDQHMQSQKWQIPRQIHPDRVDLKQIETAGRWQMPPKKPRFQGKMVFLTNRSAISYAESCMSIVAHYKLGEIIGSPTAGANGNINPSAILDGYRIVWTGMRVMNHDDSQHHVNGVQPTIPLEPTIAGIRAGRDELLEKAIEIINP